MGKGGGRGRGKGGCECCEAIHAFACCLCLMLVGGPILLAVGGSILATATRNERNKDIKAVQRAVDNWDDLQSTSGWRRFQNARFFADLTALESRCDRIVLELMRDQELSDKYSDEQERFGGKPQLRFKASLPYGTFMGCRYKATIIGQAQQGAPNVSIAVLPAGGLNFPRLDYDVLLDKASGSRTCNSRHDMCYGLNLENCRHNCESDFGGDFDCKAAEYTCKINDAYITSFAIKVAYLAQSGDQQEEYRLDAAHPDVFGGGNVLPAGYIRKFSTDLNSTLAPGPIFQLSNIVTPRYGSPTNFTLVVRSSADPWLSYMAVTEGSGDFGVAKSTLVVSGSVLVVMGSLATLLWFVTAFYAWRMLCSRRRPTTRPHGVEGYAWDLANRFGGQYAPALGVPVHATGQDGLPTAQPVYAPPGPYGNLPAPGQPATGYPCTGPYPPPYGLPPPPAGGYPGYAYPPAYPPVGSVEMQSHTYAPPVTAMQQLEQQRQQQQPPPQQQQPPVYLPQQQQQPPVYPPGGISPRGSVFQTHQTAAVPPAPGSSGTLPQHPYAFPYHYPPYGNPPAAGPLPPLQPPAPLPTAGSGSLPPPLSAAGSVPLSAAGSVPLSAAGSVSLPPPPLLMPLPPAGSVSRAGAGLGGAAAVSRGDAESRSVIGAGATHSGSGSDDPLVVGASSSADPGLPTHASGRART